MEEPQKQILPQTLKRLNITFVFIFHMVHVPKGKTATIITAYPHWKMMPNVTNYLIVLVGKDIISIEKI